LSADINSISIASACFGQRNASVCVDEIYYLGWLNPHSDEQFRALERKLDGLPDFPDLVR
jgi:hypothetical protein